MVKQVVAIYVILMTLALSACAPKKVSSAPANLDGPSAPEVSTTLPDNNQPPNTEEPNSGATITMQDNGQTFTYHVGDTFLLNLGNDIYDWEVTVDDQTVIALKVGVMVINGAQGLFDALAPGTATLTAVGSPQCLKSNPPCMMPTVLFKVTVVVK